MTDKEEISYNVDGEPEIVTLTTKSFSKLKFSERKGKIQIENISIYCEIKHLETVAAIASSEFYYGLGLPDIETLAQLTKSLSGLFRLRIFLIKNLISD